MCVISKLYKAKHDLKAVELSENGRSSDANSELGPWLEFAGGPHLKPGCAGCNVHRSADEQALPQRKDTGTGYIRQSDSRTRLHVASDAGRSRVRDAARGRSGCEIDKWMILSPTKINLW